MERPGGISSGEAMRWNADVERRRREHHARRCAEEPVYRRAYERQLEMMQRIQKMTGVAFSQLTNAMGEAEDAKCRQATNQTAVDGQPQSVKSHEEVMRDRALVLERVEQYRKAGAVGFGDCVLAAGILASILADGDKVKQYLEELEEEKPYAEEIRRTDREFDSELIRLSGFEW